jgi:hypothetical protein
MAGKIFIFFLMFLCIGFVFGLSVLVYSRPTDYDKARLWTKSNLIPREKLIPNPHRKRFWFLVWLITTVIVSFVAWIMWLVNE